MLQLRRVRLESVGHPNARFAPLELDLVDEEQRPVHTVVWLRNGGGKSSLLNLLFAVVRPHRREFLGSNDDGKDRRLADYVLAGDTSHVCLEWGRAGVRRPSLVTGMTMEWRDRTPADDVTRLRRLWYAFVPSDHREPGLLADDPVLTFDTVPTTEDGRRLSLNQFRDRLRTLAASDTTLQLVTPSSQAEWRRELEAHDLDPEVLRYQLQMNREEGGASELFKRRSRTAAEFVDLLLELAVADERTDRIADVYSRYADELARRPAVERNRDLLAGALERLEPLGALDAERSDTTSALRDTLRAGRLVASELRHRATTIREHAGATVEQAAQRRRDADAAVAREAELRTQAEAVLVLAARRDVAAAQDEHDATEGQLASAQMALAAAELLEPLARRAVVDAEIAALDDASDGADSRVAQARAQLVARLRADAAATAQAIADEHDRAAACQGRIDELTAEAQQATAASGRLEQSAATLRERLDAWYADRAALEQRDVIVQGEDVSHALDRTRQALEATQQRRADAQQRTAALQADLRNAYAQVAEIDGALADARARTATVEHAVAQVAAAAAAVAGDARLRELTETDAVDLWRSGSDLAARLEGLAADNDRALLDEAVIAASDRAALVALQTDGLLPPRAEVATVVALLDEHNVQATPGWRYLAERVDQSDRANLLAAAAHALDGVVVLDAAALPDAAEIVSGLDEPLRSVVLAGPPPDATDAVDAGGYGALASTTIVAPVDPALYDRAQAERARTRLRARLSDADRSRAARAASRDRDAALADRIRRLLAAHPATRRAELDDEVERTRREERQLREQRDAARDRLAQLHDRDAADQPALAADDREATLTQAVAELRALEASRVDPKRIDASEADHRAAQRRADDAAEQVARLRRDAAQHLVTAQRHRDDHNRLTDELADLEQATSAVGAPFADDTEHDDTPTEVLRRRMRVLQADIDGHAPQDATAQRRAALTERRAELSRDLTAADERALEQARRQLATPDGRDQWARAEARRTAVATRDAALEARAAAAERLRAAHAALAQMRPPLQDVDLPEHLDPATVTAAAARTVADDLIAHADRQRDEALGAGADADRIDRAVVRHRQQADAFEHLRELLAIELRNRQQAAAGVDSAASPDGPDVPDDPAAARELVDQIRSRISDQSAHVDRASKAVTVAAAELRQFVSDDRFAELDGPVRSRLADDPVGVIRDEAQLVEQLRVRLTQCEQKLDELAAHRRLLVREIAADTQRGLWLLRQADHVSALPVGFGAWSEQRFLQISFATPAVDEELAQRLETMVEQLVDEGVRPAGVPLLQRAVHAAVGPSGFTVRILKPNPALSAQRVPVTELATFSGGEQLTAAILLYCTLARLRAQARQTQTAAGMLTLDNPIGKSSNVTLLQLQRRVADAMGVQLVYTTAVDDREAVGVLPHWIRLRNERRDMRTGNLHVETAGGYDQAMGEIGAVSATQLWRRADPATPAPAVR